MGLQTTRLEDDPLRGSFVLFISKNRVVTTPTETDRWRRYTEMATVFTTLPRQKYGGDILEWPQ